MAGAIDTSSRTGSWRGMAERIAGLAEAVGGDPVHRGEVAAGAVSGLVAPQAPAAERWETLWHYMQSGPGVFKGDLYFYGIDGDVRSELGRIDIAQCPLYLLTGEYDYSCTPEDTLAVARAVPGAQVTIMKELGHFPMSENPALFLSYLEPVLAEIAERK